MRILTTALIALAFTVIPLSANKHAKAGACKADVEKFCGAHKGNRKAMKDCINANKDKFSAECKAKKEENKAKRADRKAKFDKALEVCQTDLQKICPADKDKKPQAFRCLMKNRDKVSAECKAALPEKRVKKEK